MSKTLLAVDDSATMRKVLDITFSGEDFRVVGAENRDSALAKLSEQPNVVVLDLSLGAEDSYALAKEIRQRAPSATIVLMASRYNPYDANKGRDAGVDDSVDKPFDTQQMIEKVKKAMLAREAGGGVAAAAPAAAVGRPSTPGTGPSGTVPSIQSPFQQQAGATRPTGAAPPAPPPPPPPPPKPAVVPVSTSTSRTHTLSFENSPFAAPPAPPAGSKAPAPTPQPTATAIGAPPPPPPAPAPPAAARPAAAPVAAAVNGALSGKLSELGLTPAQADAVLALSREVVERIVWEVVPQLAETIIKEEIARLTKEG